jgi:hypothetical protein
VEWCIYIPYSSIEETGNGRRTRRTPTSLLLPTSLRRRCGSPAGPFPPSKELAAFSPCYYGGCVLQSAVQCSACVFPIFVRPFGRKIRKLVCCSTAAPVVSPVSHGAGRIRDPRGQPSSPPPGSPVPSAAGASRPLGPPLPVTTDSSAAPSQQGGATVDHRFFRPRSGHLVSSLFF